MELRFRVKYEGLDADLNRLPAHEAGVSLEGIAWSFNLVGHYISTGVIRHRGQLSTNIKFYMHPPKRGSFVTDIVALVQEPGNLFITSLAGAYAVATATDAINGTIKYCFRSVCGVATSLTRREQRQVDRLPSGDTEALMDSIEPSMRRAHTVIDDGAAGIDLIYKNTPLLKMDHDTKQYVSTEISNEIPLNRSVSIGALNVNSGNGRAYLPEVGKTVSFSVVREPMPGTYEALSNSLSRYARGVPSLVWINCTEIYSIDQRVKKLLILGAWPYAE